MLFLFVIIAGGGIVHIVGQKKSVEEALAQPMREVTLALVSDLAGSSSPLPLLGTVVSRNEAIIRAESSGKLMNVYKKLGDHVAAGTVIAEFENSGERAAVLQAEGAYESAKATQGMATINTNIAEINTDSSSISLQTAKTQALNTLTAAYTSFDNAVRAKTDSQFSNPQTREAKFNLMLSDSKLLITLEEQHVNVESLITKREVRNRTLSIQDNLLEELDIMTKEANTIKTYLDNLALALTHSIPDTNTPPATIEAYKTATGLARAEIGATLAALSVSKNALSASIAGNKVSEKNLTQTNEGSAAIANASLKSALGNLQAAQSRLNKTIIRSPISGTLNSLAVATGDFVSPYQEIGLVSNNGALEVVAYITEEDAKEIAVDTKVNIDGANGIITRIAPALDPKTKKIEVRIGILGNARNFVNGQSLQIQVPRAHPIHLVDTNAPIELPLSTLKITPTGAVVFTVNAKNELEAHPVKEGALLGDRIIILEGLTPDMRIVTDARGLKAGTRVTIKE